MSAIRKLILFGYDGMQEVSVYKSPPQGSCKAENGRFLRAPSKTKKFINYYLTSLVSCFNLWRQNSAVISENSYYMLITGFSSGIIVIQWPTFAHPILTPWIKLHAFTANLITMQINTPESFSAGKLRTLFELPHPFINRESKIYFGTESDQKDNSNCLLFCSLKAPKQSPEQASPYQSLLNLIQSIRLYSPFPFFLFLYSSFSLPIFTRSALVSIRIISIIIIITKEQLISSQWACGFAKCKLLDFI